MNQLSLLIVLVEVTIKSACSNSVVFLQRLLRSHDMHSIPFIYESQMDLASEGPNMGCFKVCLHYTIGSWLLGTSKDL